MKRSNLLLILAIAMASNAAHAAQPPAEHAGHHHMAMQSAAGPVKHGGFGIIKGVDAAAGKVKIAHEAIPALNWPGMTMWFTLRGTLSKEVNVGDSVRFELQQSETKEWVITRIERKK